jgi:type IV pilus assembly protein PilM
MPDVGEAQLKRIIPIEARKYIPMPTSEVMLDWFVLPKDVDQDAFDRVTKEPGIQKKGVEVLLAAIHNETLHTYQAIAESADLQVNFFEIEIFSAVRSSLGSGIEPVIIVDIGAATTKMYVVERGIVRTSHLLNIGSQAMTERLARTMSWEFEKAERIKREWGLNGSSAYSREENQTMQQALLSTLTRIFSETNRVLLDYGKRYNKNVPQIVYTGGGASLPGLASVAQEALGVEVHMADPFGKVETPAFLDEVLHDIGPGFAVATGVALRKLQQFQ